jgi:hypothetical protein
MASPHIQLPEHTKAASGELRRVGVELEFSDIDPEAIARSVQEVCGGDVRRKSMFEFEIADTDVGDFVIELDATLMKKAGTIIEDGVLKPLGDSLESLTTDLISTAAEQLVPWELVSPPVPLDKLDLIYDIVADLRANNAKGTKDQLRYAFGTHLNPELPGLDADTIVAFFKAYLCLYEWICREEKIDFSRKVTPYINHFEKDYVIKVVDPDYWPDLDNFIDDYLTDNPTRKRSLDLLPLFCHLDEARLRAVVDDPRVKPRPTFHYRLPNCEIGNPDWNIDVPWGHWLEIEKLAFDREKLDAIGAAYSEHQQALLKFIEQDWPSQVDNWLKQ